MGFMEIIMKITQINAATKIQSKFRDYLAKKKYRSKICTIL